MKKAKNRKAFTIVELVIVIAVIAVLATVLVPTLGDVINKAKDSAAMQEAKNAYTQYLVEHAAKGEVGEYYLYESDEDRVVALHNGSAIGVYTSRREALNAIFDDPETVNIDESTSFSSLRVSADKKLLKVEPKKAVICFTFDDGNTDDAQVYSLFKEKGLVCSFALLASDTAKYSQYLSYQNQGYEIISHSTDGSAMKDGNIDTSIIEAKIKTSKEKLEAAGFKINAWVTPSSQMHENFIPLVRQYYKLAFTVFLGDWDTDATNGAMTPYNTVEDNVHKLHRVSLESTSVVRVKQAIDEAVKNVGFLNFYAHGFNKYPPKMTQAELEEILDYVKQYVDNGDCIVTTVSSGFDYFYQESVDTTSTNKENSAPKQEDIPVVFTYKNGFFTSETHGQGYGKLVIDDRFAYSSAFEVKAGQTVIIYGCFNSNVAGLIQVDSAGTPIEGGQLLTGASTVYETKEWRYTADNDMYCVVCTRYGNGYLPSLSDWIITLQDSD